MSHTYMLANLRECYILGFFREIAFIINNTTQKRKNSSMQCFVACFNEQLIIYRSLFGGHNNDVVHRGLVV